VADDRAAVESYRLVIFCSSQAARNPFHGGPIFVYFRRGSARAVTAAAASAQHYAANPALPGGQSEQRAPGVGQAEYRRLLESLTQSREESRFRDWRPTTGRLAGRHQEATIGRMHMGIVQPGLFGANVCKFPFPPTCSHNGPAGGRTWPSSREMYLLAGWLKCRELTGGAQLHVHFRNAQGQLCPISR